MSYKSEGQTLLDNAYKLSTPNDSVEFYNAFASTYDTDFADKLGFFYPTAIAEIFWKEFSEADTPIADIGCGTGLVAKALDVSQELIDGIDISTEMLRISKEKQLYQSLYEVDLTKSLDQITHDSNKYGAVISAGTFTSGHLGPKPLKALIDIARAGALFVIGVKQEFYDKAGFEPVLRDMQASGLITNLKATEVPVYEGIEHEHSNDKAFVLVYRKN